MRKEFKKLSKYHTKLKEIHQFKDISSLTKTIQNSEAYETFKKELCLENEKVSKERDNLMQDFHILEGKLKFYKKS